MRRSSIGPFGGRRKKAMRRRRMRGNRRLKQSDESLFSCQVVDVCGKLRHGEVHLPIITSGERAVIIKVFNDKIQLGEAAARQGAGAIESAISEHGRARIIAATGMSQFEFLNALTKTPGVDWAKVEMFHLDEYVGLPATHPASFRKYLLERLIEPAGITRYHLLYGE